MKRRISVIVFVDVVGYTTLMQKDEAAAAKVLHRFQEVVDAKIEEHEGRVIDFYGDGAICAFDTAESALSYSLYVQESFKSPEIPVRVGMHLGSVVEENGRIYGDAVNLASRVESIGQERSILMSKAVRDQVKNKPEFQMTSLGHFRFKNVAEELEVFALANAGLTVPERKNIQGKLEEKANKSFGLYKWAALLLMVALGILFLTKKLQSPSKSQSGSPQVNSIAVLPFKNFTGNPELEYFCDGITDDIIGRLTKVTAFDKVISRTSAFQYKETDKSMTEIGDELGVNTILEGSVQKSGDQIKVLLQLIDAPADQHIWSTEYMGKWHSNDVFEIQKQVTQSVVTQLDMGNQSERITQATKPITDDPEAYELYLKAEFLRNKASNDGMFEALDLYKQALSIDPSIEEAHSAMATIYMTGGLIWGLFDQKEAEEKTIEHLQPALLTDTSVVDLNALFGLAFYYNLDFEKCEQLLSIERSEPIAAESDFYMKTGRYDRSIESAKWGQRVSPLTSSFVVHEAKAHFLAGDLGQATALITEGDRLFPDDPWYLREVAILNLYMGKLEAFKSTSQTLLAIERTEVPVRVWFAALIEINDGKEPSRMIESLEKMYQQEKSGSPAWFLSMLYFYNDDSENGFLWLQRSHDRREVEITWLREGFLLKPYHSDPRYQALYKEWGWQPREI